MNTIKNSASVRRGRSTPTVARTKSIAEQPKGIKPHDSAAQLSKNGTNTSRKLWMRKKTVVQAASPATTVRFTSDHKKVSEKVDQKPRLTALEEIFPKHVLEDIRNSSEPSKREEEDDKFYKLLVQSLYVSDQTIEPVPEQMNSEQLEQLISKTQKEMAEVEEKLQVKERQRARLLRWWEVKHDMLSYLFKCKSVREGKPELYIEHMTQSQC